LRKKRVEADLKQVIVVRTDLKMSQGKLAAQACHASLGSSEIVKDKQPRVWRSWQADGGRKIVVGIESKEELVDISNRAGKLGICKYLVRDKGLTEIPPGSMTALGLGPDSAQKIDKVTGTIPLLK
jgi:PTH2 family peptidyl-tRNA hydrolase